VFWLELRRAAREDESLRNLLASRGIDLTKGARTPQVVTQATRDQLLRKIKPVLMLRNEFRKVQPAAGPTSGKVAMRSRKRVSLYAGAEAVYAMSDGNPRWLIGMLRDMLARVHQAQADVVNRTSHRYKALLSMLPKSIALVNSKEVAMVDVLDRVGKHFFERMVRGPFPLDPVGSFIVDSNAHEPLLALIKLAVSQGALVYVDPDWKVAPSNPRGKRFRLSFLLAPTYRLPLRLYDPVPLSTCLGERLPRRWHTSGTGTDVSQAELFGD
jgi:hypothetical protein